MQTINKHKIKSPHILLLMLLLTFLSISIPTLTAHATDIPGAAGNGDGNGDKEGNSHLTTHSNEGYPSWMKTGWLVYISNTSGQLCSDVVFVSSGSNLPDGHNGAYLTTRIGNAPYSTGKVYTNAEWGAPFIEGAARGSEIKNMLVNGTDFSTDGKTNAYYVIQKYLGISALELFQSSADYYLVLETCAWHKIFTGNYQGYYVVASASGFARLQQDSAMNPTGDSYTGWLDNGLIQTSAYLDKDWPGLPNVPSQVSISVDDPSTYISNSTLSGLGYGMIAVRSTEASTHTWDSENHPNDEAPAPEPPEPESSTPPSPTDYQYIIIKSYRLKDESGNLIDKGTYSRTNTVATIAIEDEPLNTTDKNYKVIGWKTSTTTNFGISSITWESSVPQAIGTTGSSPTTTTLTSHYKVLYVLLEAQLTEPLIANYNYILPESSITRRISYSNPDFSNTNMIEKISTHRFVFMVPAHNPTTCPGHTWTHNDDDPSCTNSHTESGDCNCTAPVGHDPNCGIYDEWEVCDGHSYTCIDFQFTDDSLLFGIKNSLSHTYPSILASNWSFEIPVGDPSPTEKNISINRNSPYHHAYNKYFNAYGVIMRGDDKLSLAEWKNTNASLAANTKLPQASSVKFTVSNTQHGNRQTADYTKVFNANFISDILDPDTTYEATSYIGNETPTGSLCGSTVNIASASSLSYNSIGVNVKVYSGSATSTSVNTATNSHILLTSGNKIESGSSVSSGKIDFIPYIEMKYDINTVAQTVPYTAYVLGEYTRSLNFNSYAGILWEKKTSASNLTLESTQWSTHAEANKTHDVGTVLPGGATLTLSIKNSDRQKITVVTYQPILAGAGKEQVDKTGGNSSALKSLDAARANHEQFVEEVRRNLENFEIQQYYTDQDNKNASSVDQILGENKSVKVNNGVTVNKPHSSDSLTYKRCIVM